MSTRVHFLSAIDHANKSAVCAHCGPVAIKIRRQITGLPGEFRYRCVNAERAHTAIYERTTERRKRRAVRKRVARQLGILPDYNRPWVKFKKPACERCGHKPPSLRGLDVHHRDHNRKNNHPDNLETLCATCHRLEHFPEHQATG